MTEGYAPTRSILQVVKGLEPSVLKALGIRWDGHSGHMTCLYPDHTDHHPSRRDGRKARAFCTCIEQRRGHSIFDVVMGREGVEFESARLRVAEILERHDLIKERGGEQHQAMGEANYSYRAVARARTVSHFFIDRRSRGPRP